MFKATLLVLTLSLVAVEISGRWHIHNPFKHIRNPLKHLHVRKTLDHLKNAVTGSLKHARQEVNNLTNHIKQLGQKILKDSLQKLEKIFEAYLLQIPQIQKIVGPALKALQCVKNLEKQIKSLPKALEQELQKYINGEIDRILKQLEGGLKSEKEVEALLKQLEQGWSDKHDKNDDELLKNIQLNENLPNVIDSAAAKSVQAAQAALNAVIQLATNKVDVGSSAGKKLLDTMRNCAKIV